MRVIRLMMAMLMLLALPTLSPAADGKLKVGDAAPDFEMQGSDGETYELADFKGKRAFVLAWFPKAFTGGCTAQCKSFRENGKAIREFDVAYFTASVDPVEKNKEFSESLDLDYPILSDPEKKAAKAFGVLNERGMASRVTIYVDKEGKIAFIDEVKKAGEDGANVATKLAELKVAKAPKKDKSNQDDELKQGN